MSQRSESAWSAPDKDGIVTCTLDVGAVSTLRGRRKRRGCRPRPDDIALWPAPWRDLVREWLKQGGARRKWTNLLMVAGSRRAQEAWQLLDALLKAGLIEVEERRDNTRWQPLWLEFLDLEAARELVGLANREKVRQLRDKQEGTDFQNPILSSLLRTLEEMPAERAIRRHGMLIALDQWISGGFNGTRRDFALFARGDTKGVSAAEWSWIDGALSLENIGISRHTPAIWLRVPLALRTATGTLDLRCIPDCIGLTPETIGNLVACEGQVGSWGIVENRTVFERVARHRGGVDGVIWVPGFAPSWWKQGVARLLSLSPATALVACDPDPAGIEIALNVGRVWEENGFGWAPWGMDAGTLSTLPKRKGLNEDDISRLNRLMSQPLPAMLRELAAWMLHNGEKGEQEGISF